MTALFLQKFHFCLYMGQRSPKTPESFVILFYLKQSGKRIIEILVFPSQISCPAKFLVLRYCPRCSQPVDYRILESRISQEWVEVWNWSFYWVANQLGLIWYSYNHFHYILRLFDVLPNFSFTTSETMRNYFT